ncbi:MAG TPA: acyl-CoA dehydrogenase family protein [Pseudonocardiaceae bacterium]|jgi:hypothetical protein|nr:acyl-CoA dehydrogenase family protein [Pseudonocardiaceae bacterium]
MKFSLSAEQRDFAASLRALLTSEDALAVGRAWQAGDRAPGRALWARLAELGVPALAVPERWGGLGADPIDLVVAFEELGRFAVPGPLIETIAVVPALLTGIEPGRTAETWLPRLAAGDVLASVAMLPHVPYALDADLVPLLGVLDQGTLWCGTPGGSVLSSVDPSRRLFRVRRENVLGAVDGTNAFNVGALACAAQLLGAGHALLDTSTEYAAGRVQFGRPIGSFQAVKHHLADVLVGLELARPLVYGAAVALAAGSVTADRDCSAAKVACADAANRAARIALQVHGAIGYTQECSVGRWLTRVRALVSAWGNSSVHRDRVLAALLADGGATQ